MKLSGKATGASAVEHSVSSDTYVRGAKVFTDVAIFIGATILVCFANFEYDVKDDKLKRHSVPVVFDVWKLEPNTTKDSVEVFFERYVHGKNLTAVHGYSGETSFKNILKFSLGCSVTALSGTQKPAYCTECAEVWGKRIFLYGRTANTALTYTGTVKKDLDKMEKNLEACIFRDQKYWEARHVFYLNPWTQFFVWCGLMAVYSILAHCTPLIDGAGKITDKNAHLKSHQLRERAGFFQMTTYVPAGILVVFILSFWIWFTESVPVLYVKDGDDVNTWKFDWLHVAVLYALIALGPIAVWSGLFAERIKWNTSADESLHDMPRTAMLDYTIIMASVPMMTIVCAFRGWLEYNMMQYFYMTVLCILVLSLLDDSLILLLKASPLRKEVDQRHRSAHFTIVITMVFVFVFFFFTSFPSSVPGDPYHGQLISILFYTFLVSIIATSATINDLSETVNNSSGPRMDGILWVKEGIEVFFRIVVFFWLVSVYNMHYTLD